MADPISSLTPNANNACIDDDGDANASIAPLQSNVVPEPPNQSRLDDSSSQSPPNGVQSLVQKFSPPTLPAALPKSAPPSMPASAIVLASPRVLVTSSGAVPGGGSYRVAGSLLKDEIKTGALAGSNTELGTVSVQYGKDNDVQLVGGRRTMMVNGGGFGLSVTTEVGLVRANLGENNDDGSVGGNIGAGAELAGGEATLSAPFGSLTGGLSVSLSLSGSMGVRDADHDGKEEYCGKFSIPAYTLGACIERFW